MADLYSYSYAKLVVDIDGISIKIKTDPEITKGFDHAEWAQPKNLTVYFKAMLTDPEKARLDVIVSEYAGESGGYMDIYCSDCDAWYNAQPWVKSIPAKCPGCQGINIKNKNNSGSSVQTGSVIMSGIKSLTIIYKVPFLRKPRIRVSMPRPSINPVVKNQTLEGFTIDFQTTVKDTEVEWDAVN